MFESLAYQFTRTFIEDNHYKTFIGGFKTTITIAFFALIIGVILGVIAAIIKSYDYREVKTRSIWTIIKSIVIKALKILVDIYLLIFRGTPVVMQLMILYYIVLINIQSGVIVAIIGFGINSGAYVAEIVRAGILSIDRGQTEAGRSLGLSEAMTMKEIVLPQAIKNTLPPLFNEFITLLKETSVAGYITVIDLTKASDLVRSRTMQAFFPLISVAVVYLILVVGLTSIQSALERRLRKSDRR